MAKNVVIRPSVREQYQKFMARGRVLFFTAPCGFGKSILAETLLAGQQVLSLTAGEPDFALPGVISMIRERFFPGNRSA